MLIQSLPKEIVIACLVNVPSDNRYNQVCDLFRMGQVCRAWRLVTIELAKGHVLDLQRTGLRLDGMSSERWVRERLMEAESPVFVN